jgi:diguanylate cyclase (GGDEF)-like protein
MSVPVMEGGGLEHAPTADIIIRPEDLEGAARLLTRVSDPRAAVCLAASWMLRADVAELWEPGDQGLVLAASTEQRRFSRSAPAIATQVIETGRAQRRPGDGDAGAVFVAPVQRGRRTVGALLVRWRRAVDDVDATSRACLALLAAQAALAIERADLADELARQAETDPLTGVANRRGLARALERDLAAARRNDRRLAVAVIDLDHFKAYNDTEGHHAGDLLLRGAARAWKEHLRAGDLLARYGGEEFVVVLPDAVDAAAAVRAIERVRESTPGVTASAGVALWSGREPAALLIRRADGALYEAKRGGRNRTVMAAPVMRVASHPSSSQTDSR